ncbi:ribosome biogenesis factor YjgA [Methylotenera versatilis]|uniref:ribosome biogenesis factor YjgA n=1 Tax=Methylotenera versatilis TaxID=1055487 RepID=UPI000647CA54|nr:ribosome biogenesis factor YjgA [Methylotenera versatilis]
MNTVTEKEPLIEPISKTKLKAEADAQQAIGKKLINLSKDKLIKLDLPEALFDAVMEAKRLTANGAVRRQLQYIGRLMRDVDNAPIVEQLSAWEGKNTQENARFHTMERWRARLIAEPNALSEFLTKFPQADIQQIRTLIRNAQREATAEKPPKSSRELFKLIREISEVSEANKSDESDQTT